MSFPQPIAVPMAAPAPLARRRVAVFVDGENLSPVHAGRILTTLGGRTDLRLARVYGDMARGVWAGVTGFRFVHAGSGKNAADLLLCIEAMAAWHSGHCATIAVATSDRDFSHLALWLREAGAEVIGLGEVKAPAALRHACSRWVGLEPPAVVSPATAVVVTPPLSALEATAISELQSAGGHMTLGALGSLLGKSTAKSDLAEKNWRGFVVARPHLFAVDPLGPNARVRLVQTRSTVTRSLA